MPKMKTSAAAKKRFSKKPSGLVKRSSAFRRHLLTSKTKKRKRGLRQSAYICSTNMRSIASLLPY